MRRHLHIAGTFLVLAFTPQLAGCSRSATPREVVVVFAAASLTAVFTEVGTAFERAHPGVRVDLHFAGTSRLIAQLQTGARADVLATADEVQMARASTAGLVSGEAQRFASNHLALVVARDNPRGVSQLADLADPQLRVALCAPQVPAGAYARLALARAGVVVHSISDEPSVTAVVTKVRMGEVDAGIVYATDVLADDREVQAVLPEPSHQVTAHYAIASLTPATASAAGFVAHVLSPAGQACLRKHGFAAP